MRKVKVFETVDGQRFDSEEAAIAHEKEELKLRFKCEACNGTGRLIDKEKPIYVERKEFDGMDNYHYFQDVGGYEEKTCNFCNGKGRLKMPLTPIVQTIGWKQ
jgi:DnaJ-class molecular chaperone